MPFVPYDYPTIWGTITAACQTPDCGWTKRFQFSNGMRLNVGDPLPSGEDPTFNICMKCKCKNLKVTKVPEEPVTVARTGFWKVPIE